MRRQRLGVPSLVMIWCKRFAARGVIAIDMASPVSSSMRGLSRVVVVLVAGGGGGGGEGVEVWGSRVGLRRAAVLDMGRKGVYVVLEVVVQEGRGEDSNLRDGVWYALDRDGVGLGRVLLARRQREQRYGIESGIVSVLSIL